MSKDFQEIVKTLKDGIRVIPDESGILFAVSGGPDSVALLDIVVNEMPQIKGRIHIAYIHHGLRKNADMELAFVKQLSKNYQVVFHCKKIKIKKEKGMSIEEQARIKRYKALVEIARKSKCKVIVTAHTLDDQVETIMLNLITGTGLKGLCGMQPVSQVNDIVLLRPMLSISKSQILSYLEKKKLRYMIDESNLNTKFARNFLRHRVFPLLEKINPSCKKNISRTAKILRDDYDFLSSFVAKKIKKYVVEKNGYIEFSRRMFMKQSVSVQRFFLRQILINISKSAHPPDFAAVENLRNLISQKKQGFLNKMKIYAVCDGNKVGLSTKVEEKNIILKSPVKIAVPGEATIPEIGWKIITEFTDYSEEFFKNQDKLVAYVNAEKVKQPLILKQPNKNENFIPLGMRKVVSFKKYWKTHKKNISVITKIPLVIEDGKKRGKIVWVLGGHISQFFGIKKNKPVLKISASKLNI
ncbi:MAG TPA: tRNA lysidine(34) synthetase TilS [bacterium]|nr:tRNA lysidine(34) synthetase TilS [bacterium]HOL35324.1 tRNA lysidine(34) synthetase TilS [bacterium]HPP08735.1 tRNA lysidine(34) synthetase TilS [bacterium]